MQKVKKSPFLVAIVLFDTIMHQNSTLWNSGGQGHLVTLWKLSSTSYGSCLSHFQRTSSLKLLGQFHLNFICDLQAKGKYFYIFCPGHMTKMAAMPIYRKNLKNSSFLEPLG